MNIAPSPWLAFGAGLLSFASPCVLPLVPSYLSFVGGASYRELATGNADRRVIVWRTAWFVLGFSIVFVAFGMLFSRAGYLISHLGAWINLTAGAIIVFFGLHTLFDLAKVLNVERRVRIARRPASVVGATAVGMAFGAGWSPCIGPILGTILFLAGYRGGSVGQAALLLAAYALGLGAPFVLTACAFVRAGGVIERLKRRPRAVRIVSGASLIVVGLAVAFGRFVRLTGSITAGGYRLARWSAAEPVAHDVVFTIVCLALAAPGPAVRLAAGKRAFTPLNAAFGIAMVGVAVSLWIGALDLGRLLGAWLRFEGI